MIYMTENQGMFTTAGEWLGAMIRASGKATADLAARSGVSAMIWSELASPTPGKRALEITLLLAEQMLEVLDMFTQAERAAVTLLLRPDAQEQRAATHTDQAPASSSWNLRGRGNAAQERLSAIDEVLIRPRPAAPWRLFLDDERVPTYLATPALLARGMDPTGPWEVARNEWEAQAMVCLWGLPAVLSLDHDLGERQETGDGHGLCLWLAERHLDGLVDLKKMRYQVHSSNPVGAQNMAGVLDGVLRASRQEG